MSQFYPGYRQLHCQTSMYPFTPCVPCVAGAAPSAATATVHGLSTSKPAHCKLATLCTWHGPPSSHITAAAHAAQPLSTFHKAVQPFTIFCQPAWDFSWLPATASPRCALRPKSAATAIARRSGPAAAGAWQSSKLLCGTAATPVAATVDRSNASKQRTCGPPVTDSSRWWL